MQRNAFSCSLPIRSYNLFFSADWAGVYLMQGCIDHPGMLSDPNQTHPTPDMLGMTGNMLNAMSMGKMPTTLLLVISVQSEAGFEDFLQFENCLSSSRTGNITGPAEQFNLQQILEEVALQDQHEAQF